VPGAPERLIALGAVVRPHGLRGEVRVHRFNPESTLLLEQERVWLRRDGATREMHVKSSRAHGDLVLYVLEGVVGREAAEALRGSEVCLPREALPPPDEDEYYHADLIGLRAVDPSGLELGVVSDVIQYPSTDCLAIDSEAGRREVPILDPYLVGLDLEAGTITLAHAEDFEPQPVRDKGAKRR
jgi:16S rRNA processing protein RimM